MSSKNESTNVKDIVAELEEEGITADQAIGFDIFGQSQAAEREDEGTVVHVRGIDDKPLYFQRGGKTYPVTIRVAGSNSSRYREAENRNRKKKLKASSLTGQALYDENIEKTAYCTLGWDGFTDRGTEVPCTQHNAAMVYKKCPWVLNQVIEAMNDHERFFSNNSVEL